MIKRNFALKMISCIIIVAALFYYNQMMIMNTELANANTRIQQMAGTTASEGTAQKSEGGAKYKDGTYSGTAKGYGGPVTTRIVISSGKISGIEITSASGEDSAYYNMCLPILDEIAAAQSADVDTVSGATYTSKGIINGAEDALRQAAK